MAELSADIVVIGGGIAGMCAALSAQEQGCDVLVLEGMESIGGSTVLSGGLMAFAGTDLQKAEGVEDTDDLLRSDILEIGLRRNDIDLVNAYVRNQLDTYYWLRDRGVVYRGLEIGAGQSVRRSHVTDPADTIRALSAVALKNGVRIETNARVRRLRRPGRGGARWSVDADRVGEVDARRSVVVTTGGFSRSQEMLDEYVPELRGCVLVGGKGNVGDGLILCREHGAGTRDMGHVTPTFGHHPTAGDGLKQEVAMAVYKGAIIVTKQGERFIDESLPYKVLGMATVRVPGKVVYQIFDKKVMDSGKQSIYRFRDLLDDGLVEEAGSLEELAGKLGIPGAELVGTVQTYNRSIAETGYDTSPIGRRHLSHKFGDLIPLDQPPFYGFPSTSTVLATYCGLTIDDIAAVLNVYGEPIEGLFAAGEVTGGFHGSGYVTGTSLGKGSIFARIAGRMAALQNV